MVDSNPFPDSPQKRYLRRVHLAYLSQYRQTVGRGLAYFGLPSAEMADVRLWRHILDRVVAVERDPDVALSMYRTAQEIGVREQTIVLETTLLEACRELALAEREVGGALSTLSPSQQEKIIGARQSGFDVINLDLCGGFLYPTHQGDSDNVEILKHIIAFQARHMLGFVLIVTFNLRDTGSGDYDFFIASALEELSKAGVDTSGLRRFFQGAKPGGQPEQLRRLRFCVPAYLQKIAFDHFQVVCTGTWYYKTFYHAAFQFEPRRDRRALGLTWPPIDELRELLSTPLVKLDVAVEDEVRTTEQPGPPLW